MTKEEDYTHEDRVDDIIAKLQDEAGNFKDVPLEKDVCKHCHNTHFIDNWDKHDDIKWDKNNIVHCAGTASADRKYVNHLPTNKVPSCCLYSFYHIRLDMAQKKGRTVIAGGV